MTKKFDKEVIRLVEKHYAECDGIMCAICQKIEEIMYKLNEIAELEKYEEELDEKIMGNKYG